MNGRIVAGGRSFAQFAAFHRGLNLPWLAGLRVDCGAGSGVLRMDAQMKPFVLRSLAIFLAFVLTLDQVWSCPFCLAPPQTFSEQFVLSDFVVVAGLLRVQQSAEGQPARSVLRVRAVLAGAEPDLKACGVRAGAEIVYPGELTGEPGDLFLLYGDRGLPSEPPLLETFSLGGGVAGGGAAAADVRVLPAASRGMVNAGEPVDWTENLAISGACFEYLRGLPVRSRPAALRLQFYAVHLESADAEVAGDAWAEFAGAAYEDVKANRSLYQPARLRQWIGDPLMSPERLGLYGLLLGLSGDAGDAQFLRQQFLNAKTGEFRFGAEGLLGGYLLLTGESGLAELEREFLGPGGRDTMRLALAQSLDFFRTYEPTVIGAEHSSRCMRRLAAGSVLRFTAVSSLARWGDWGALPELLRLAESELGPIRPASAQGVPRSPRERERQLSGVRPIVEFAEQCVRAGGGGVEQAAAAEQFLRRVRAEYPELERVAEPEFQAPQ